MWHEAAWDGERTAWRSFLALALTLALALLFLVGQPPSIADASEPVVAQKVRIGGDLKRTRFVADLDREVGFSAYALAEPYRIVIDMPDVRFDLPADAGQKVRGLITSYRYGEVAAGRARIVIETAGPALIDKSYLLPPADGQPARLVVDLVPASEEDFTAALMASEAANNEAIRLAAEAAAGAEGEEVASAPETETPEATAPAAEKPRRHDGRRLIVIDPGHGGIDPGAIGVKRTREKDVVLAFGLALRDVLRKSGRYEVIMTRDSDTFLTLKQRVRIARANAADLFIAIHADTV
ncbi:MAG: N-acetylmuramoyl-L-alanine amidase, partial [Alphaproteobacteria bacterium]|nr:N-acetylmuramoyl-L-alanine amidase [Alphaproteobacteria bacterium]